MPELKVHTSSCDSELMVQSEELRLAFVKRLKKALADEKIPEWGVGARLAEKTLKTAKAASKWLNGESMPSRANMIAIADWLNVRVEWLAHGEGEMRAGDSQASAGDSPAPATSMNMAALLKLKGKATPRSLDVLKRIEKAAQEGRLKEADLLALEGIAARFEELNTKQP